MNRFSVILLLLHLLCSRPNRNISVVNIDLDVQFSEAPGTVVQYCCSAAAASAVAALIVNCGVVMISCVECLISGPHSTLPPSRRPPHRRGAHCS